MSPVPELRKILQENHIAAAPEQFLAVYTLTVARIGAAVPFIPFLGGETVPPQLRVGITMVVGAVLYPALSGQIPNGRVPGAGLYLALVVKELAVGSLMGLLVQIVFAAAEGAGSLIEFTSGLNPQRIFAPQQTPNATGPLSSLMGQAAIVIYVSAGLHLIFLRSLIDSYAVLPLMTFPEFRPGFGPLAEFVGRITGGFIANAFRLSAPVLLILVLIRFATNMVFRASFASLARQDPLQPVGFLAVFGVLFLSMGLLSDEIVRQASGYLLQLQQIVNAIR